MQKFAFALVGLLTVLLPTAVGYRLGTGNWPTLQSSPMTNETPKVAPTEGPASPSREVLYWKDPDGKPAFAATPAKTSDGRDYLPVYDDQEPPLPGDKTMAASTTSEAPAPKGERKVKFYRNPMGLPDTSQAPKKDWMGMDYIPVYEGEDEEDGSSVKVSLDKVQRTGVRSEPAEMRHLSRPVRAPAVAKIDERTIRDVVLRADGYIEKLYVAETGKHVKEGDPLFRVYSPEIVRAQVDYRVARRASAGQPRSDAVRDLEGAVQRLENLAVPESIMKTLRKGEAAPAMKIDWPSPVSGVVIEKKAIEGQKFSSGDLLFRLADLGKIWVVADVAEQDLGQVKVGDPATITFRAFPGEKFQGKVTFILHEVEMQTRTGKVRIEVANPDHRIRHDMYADVTLDVGDADNERLAVPVSAVLDTGVRQVVLIDKGEGRFEPRPVKLGMRGDGFVEITEGIAAGDKVVTTANFLIDAESNLKAALKGFDADSPTPSPAKPVPEPSAEPTSEKPMSDKMPSQDGAADANPAAKATP